MPLQPWKVPEYTALFTQEGTDNPTLEILYNTLGDITWGRIGVGFYAGFGPNFPPNKTFITLDNGFWPKSIRCYAPNDASIYIQTYNELTNLAEDGILFNTPIKIQIYNL